MFWHGDSHFRLSPRSLLLVLKMPLNCPGHCVRAREDLPLTVPDRRMTTDPFQLSNDVFRFNPGSKGQRDQAANGLGLRRGAPPRLSDLVKDLKKLSLLVFIHRHVEISTAGANLPC